MEAVIWDKASPINNVDAYIILENNPWAKTNDVLLIVENDTVICIENPNTIRNNMNISIDKTILEIGEIYIEELKRVKLAKQQGIDNLNSLNSRLIVQEQAVLDLATAIK